MTDFNPIDANVKCETITVLPVMKSASWNIKYDVLYAKVSLTSSNWETRITSIIIA